MNTKKQASLTGITLVFDLDGTLVNTAPDLQAALNHVLKTDGYDAVPPQVTNTIIGSGAKAMLRAGLSHQNTTLEEVQIDAMFDTFLSYYITHIVDHSAPYPNCIAMLDRLSAAGATLAVCTNKRQNLADELLNTLQLSDRFDAIVGADSVPAAKPDAGHLLETLARCDGSASQAIMIGDSQTDERAARNAGLPFVFVPFGYGPMDMSGLEPTQCIDTFDALDVELILTLINN